MAFPRGSETILLSVIAIVLLLITVVKIGEASAEMKGFVVSSGSMEPTLQVNDALTADTSVPFEELQIGEIIVFNKPGSEEGIIVSRVFEIGNDADGTRIINTKGDNNPEPINGTDIGIREVDYVGKIVQVQPGIGIIGKILSPPVNWIIFAGVVATVVYFVRKLTRKKRSTSVEKKD